MPVVRVEGELDPHAAGSLLEAMQDAMGRNGSQVIIDLKDCSYIGSAGLGVLFSGQPGPSERGAGGGSAASHAGPPYPSTRANDRRTWFSGLRGPGKRSSRPR